MTLTEKGIGEDESIEVPKTPDSCDELLPTISTNNSGNPIDPTQESTVEPVLKRLKRGK
jgi:hypothetical protein